MADTYSRLVEAGAPEIREPYFYRVKEDPEAPGTLSVQLRKRNRRFGSHVLGAASVDMYATGPLLDRVVEALSGVVRRHEKRMEAGRAVGDFSPKAA